MDPSAAASFVEKEKIPIQNTEACCVDSRRDDTQAALAKPGADAGDLLIAFAALNRKQTTADPKQILKLVVENVGGVEQFRFHTDSAADPNIPGWGCAHLRYAKLNPEDYGLTTEQMDFVFSSLARLLEQGATQVVLEGEHAEQAVIAVISEVYTIKPRHIAFVYHKTLDQKRLLDLGNALSALAGLDMIDTVREVAGQQLDKTLELVANGKPVYTTIITPQGEVSVT